MDKWIAAAALLPEEYRTGLARMDCRNAEEIRLRKGQMPTLLYDGREIRFSERPCGERDLLCVLERASGASLHTVRETLKEGYLSFRGLRIGVCGIVASSQTVDSFQRFSSLAIRVPRECRGIGRHLLSRLRENRRKGTLILSPPGGGKTTLLRDLIRGLSDSGVRVGVADERNEISASDEFDAGFDLGSHTDVLNGMPRAEGAMLLLRTMNPELIAVDEITREDDVEAIGQLAGCGVGILASAHAQTPQQMLSRPLYRSLLEGAFFTDAICITGAGANRQYRWERIES